VSATDPVAIYNAQAQELAEAYDRLEFLGGFPGLAGLVEARAAGSLALDVGAGSGRDAAKLVDLGYEVVAVEPAAAMRAEGQRRHAEPRIRWLDDRLPDLRRVHETAIAFDLVLLSAVWQHVAPHERQRAFRKLVTVLKPGALLVMTLRQGPAPSDRPMHEVTLGEVEALARMFGLEVFRAVDQPDALRRSEVRWTAVVLRMPDDGAGALPLIRGIILADDKSSTYKLGLLRAVARIAEHAPAVARPALDDPDAVDLPLGLVALFWIRMYLPLVRLGLPQLPGNSGPDRLGFAKKGFRSLITHSIAPQELRIGAVFAGERATSMHAALSEAATTIVTMPANYTRFANSDRPVFTTRKSQPGRLNGSLELGTEAMFGWGTLRVPGHVWRAMMRLGAWIDPVLVGEWARLIRSYGERMGMTLPAGQVEAAMVWEEPQRDTTLGRMAAARLLELGEQLTCVWSGETLTAARLDIDHCLPWAAWPCGDLWNLLPSDRRINQHQKRDRIPAALALANARKEITAWWQRAWLTDAGLEGRFRREVVAALPVSDPLNVEHVFAALEWRRLRLQQDQQLAEWRPS